MFKRLRKAIANRIAPVEMLTELDIEDLRDREPRQPGELIQVVRDALLDANLEAPYLLHDASVETLTIPATFEGLLVIVSAYDSIITAAQLSALRGTVEVMAPMAEEDEDDEDGFECEPDCEGCPEWPCPMLGEDGDDEPVGPLKMGTEF